MNTKTIPTPITGYLLERWRNDNHLSKSEAADAFGLQKAKWDELTHQNHSSKPITDPAVAMLFYVYKNHPESVPVKPDTDIKAFYHFLGLQDTPQDIDKFAMLTGRTTPSMYRILRHGGRPARQVIKWIEAVQRMKFTPKQSQRFMANIASDVGDCQQVDNVLIHGWSKLGSNSDDE